MNYDLYTYSTKIVDKKQFKFSVIVTTYNRLEKLKRCLKYIKNQTYTNFECIIVNDWSIDETKEYCEELCETDKRFRLINNETNKGISESRNIGIRNATGDYVCFCDDDDYYTVDKLKQCNKILSKTQHNILWHEEYRIKNNTIKKTTYKKNQLFTIQDKILLSSSAYDIGHVINKVYKMSFLRENDLWFDTRLNCFEDLHFNMRAYLKSKKMYYTNLHLYNYIIYNNSTAHRNPCILDILQWERVFKELDEQLSTDDDYNLFFKDNVNKTIKNLLNVKIKQLQQHVALYKDFDKKTLISRIDCRGERLGNILFKFIGGYSLAKKYGFDYKVQYLKSDFQNHEIIDNIIKPFEIHGKFNYDLHINNQGNARLFDKDTLDYLFNKYDVIYISNYLQSDCYINREYTNIYTPDVKIIEYINNKYGDLSDTVAISVRRGDYLKLLKTFIVLTSDWYDEVYETYFKGKNILISSDDIDWCRENIKHEGINIQFCEENAETSLFVLSMCRGGFIGSDSTFSWWAAYLGEDGKHDIVFPSRWWAKTCLNEEVIVPDRWIKHDIKDNYEKP